MNADAVFNVQTSLLDKNILMQKKPGFKKVYNMAIKTNAGIRTF